jgi:hypothetical protein
MTTTKAVLCIALAGSAVSCLADGGDGADGDEQAATSNTERVIPRSAKPLPGYANQVDPGAHDPTTLDALSGCLTFANFTQAGMYDAWSGVVAKGGEACANCHANGAYGFWAPADAQSFYDLVTQHRLPLSTFYTPIPTTIVVNEGTFSTLTGAPPHIEHPQADMTAVHAATTQLLDLSLDVSHLGRCTPSTLVD